MSMPLVLPLPAQRVPQASREQQARPVSLPPQEQRPWAEL
jgi:hypothetical protein